jgi:uncharacterized protein involved in response to NO
MPLAKEGGWLGVRLAGPPGYAGRHEHEGETMSQRETPYSPIHPGSSVREILTRYPSAEAIFERHGLLGCGGPNGPREPVAFFARVHRVDPEVLLAELNAHVAGLVHQESTPAPERRHPRAIYPLFLVTSLGVAILAGFTTGVIALASGALNWPIPGLDWLVLVQTHGRLQLYGWAGLFVFGVAFHIVPRFVASPLAHPRVVALTYGLAVVGLVLGSLPVLGTAVVPVRVAFLTGLLALLGAAVGYTVVIGATVRAAPQRPELPIRFMESGALWLVIGTAVLIAAAATSAPGVPIPPPREEPALSAVLLGFLLVTALGVSLRTLPVFMGLAATRQAAMPVVLGLVHGSIAAIVTGTGLAGFTGLLPLGRTLVALGAAGLLAAVALYLWALRLFAPAALPVAEMGTGRGWARAIRLAYIFLVIGLVILTVGTARAALAGTAVPWGVMGAARHALALGFVTLLIVGMASRVIPVFAGKPLWRAWMVDLATALLGLGTLLRVVVEAVAPYGASVPTDLALAASGPLAFAGLLAFAVNFTLTMVRRDPGAHLPPPSAGAPPRRPLRADDLLAEALRLPGSVSLLVELGLTFLADPGHRAIAARSLTIAQAAVRGNQSPDRILAALNALVHASVTNSPSGTGALNPDLTVAEVLDRWPATLGVFLRHGFTPLADPAMRQRFAPTITVRQAAERMGVSLDVLRADLERAAGDAAGNATTGDDR